MKILVKQLGGPPPGYRWQVLSEDSVHAEAGKILSRPEHFAHVKEQVEELAREFEPSSPEGTLDIKSIESYYELRDRSGILGGLNIRLFFGIHHDSQSIVLLGLIQKQNNGNTPLGDKVRMRRRWRDCLKELESDNS